MFNLKLLVILTVCLTCQLVYIVIIETALIDRSLHCRRNGHKTSMTTVLNCNLLNNFFKYLKDDRELSPGMLLCYGQYLLRVVRYLS